jgi:uncharacterized protein
MGERDRYAPGTLSWAELMTSDGEAAKAFYGRLFGWGFDDRPAGEAGTYTMCMLGDRAAAGLMAAPDEPPHWNCYITVASADDAARRAQELGATIAAPPFDVMEAGRMAVVQDPTGAFVCVWEAREHPGAQVVNVPGAMTWNDLATPDVAAAARFYGEWLGWTTEEIPGAQGYTVIRNGDRTNGGMRPLAAEEPPNWMPYFGVDDLEAASDRVTEGGGRVLVPKMTVPAGSFVVFADPQGAVSALFEGEYDPDPAD